MYSRRMSRPITCIQKSVARHTTCSSEDIQTEQLSGEIRTPVVRQWESAPRDIALPTHSSFLCPGLYPHVRPATSTAVVCPSCGIRFYRIPHSSSSARWHRSHRSRLTLCTPAPQAYTSQRPFPVPSSTTMKDGNCCRCVLVGSSKNG